MQHWYLPPRMYFSSHRHLELITISSYEGLQVVQPGRNVHDEGRRVQSLEKGLSVAAPASAEMCALPPRCFPAHGRGDKEVLGFLGCCQGDVRRNKTARTPQRTSKKQKIAEEASASNLQPSTGIRLYGG